MFESRLREAQCELSPGAHRGEDGARFVAGSVRRREGPHPVVEEEHLAGINVDGATDHVSSLPSLRPLHLRRAVMPPQVPEPICCPTMRVTPRSTFTAKLCSCPTDVGVFNAAAKVSLVIPLAL